MKTKKDKFPQYVAFKFKTDSEKLSSYMRRGNTHYEGFYYRDAGQWGVDAEWKGEKLYSVSHHDHLNGIELVEVTKEQYRIDNLGYL